MKVLRARHRQAIILTIVVVLIAVAPRVQRFSEPEVTISGLSLGDSRQTAESHLRWLDYRWVRMHDDVSKIQTWTRMDSPNVTVHYDELDRVTLLAGGSPEINGIDVSDWSLERIERRLGPSDILEYKDEDSLFYLRYSLIIERERGGIEFIISAPDYSPYGG